MDQSEILKAMQDPGFYPERPDRVDVMETHISTLFLTDRFVYKVKKPVDFGFLDFTTLSARRFFCEQEVYLNQRLSSDVYLKVLPVRERGGGFSLGDGGTIVEYAVKMRRLPEEKMMETLLRKGEVDHETIRRIAFRLIGFHSRARTDPEISIYGSAARITKNTEENFLQTRPFIGTTLNKKQYQGIVDFTQDFIARNRALFRKRIEEKKIRDCHGDIRMEHICIEDEIVIFDCVEFNRRFRYSDVAADIAFLAMDLDFHNAPALSRDLISIYVDYTHDMDLLKLIRFYKCYRAYVRGKVGSLKGQDKGLSQNARDQAVAEAKKYFALSETYAGPRPYLVITSGLTGTGKSTLAQTLAGDLGAALFQSDPIRKELASVPRGERHLDPFGKGIYAQDISRKTYDALLSRARGELKQGRPVILDATYLKAGQRKDAQDLAEKMKVPFFVVQVVCPEEEVKRRLSERMEKGQGPSDGRWEIYLEQKNIQDPVTEVPSDRLLMVNTAEKEKLIFEVEKTILLDVEM